MATCVVKPICDDNTARQIVLGNPPPYRVKYDRVNDNALSGETMYVINYKFYEGKRVRGAKLFANLSEEQDNMDSGNCRPLGRWHALGNGSGVAVACTRRELDVYKWANNWAEMCECSVVPVLTDELARNVIRRKADFPKKNEGGTKDVQIIFDNNVLQVLDEDFILTV